jgi:hypothetical protein
MFYRDAGSQPGARGWNPQDAMRQAQLNQMQAQWSGSPFDQMLASFGLQQQMGNMGRQQNEMQDRAGMYGRGTVGGGAGYSQMAPQLMAYMFGGGRNVGGGGGLSGPWF